MKVQKRVGRYNGSTDFFASRPYFTRPKILVPFFIDGVKYYRGRDGKIYIAELFNKFFGTRAKADIKPRNYKGELA